MGIGVALFVCLTSCYRPDTFNEKDRRALVPIEPITRMMVALHLVAGVNNFESFEDLPSPNDDSPSPNDDSPSPNDDSPSPNDDSPSPNDDSPSPNDDSPSPNDDSPSPNDDSPSPNDDSPSPNDQMTRLLQTMTRLLQIYRHNYFNFIRKSNRKPSFIGIFFSSP